MILKFIEKVWNKIANIIYPQSPEIEKIEKLSASDFYSIAPCPVDSPPAGVHSFFKYKDPLVRKALWNLKYKGNRKIAKLFAEIMRDFLIEKVSDESLYSNFKNPIIIPIPLSQERLKERGWNQAEMIAKEIGKIDSEFSIKINVLEKIKHTVPQTRLSREKRMKNLKDCFRVKNTDEVKNRNIILIDDVTTTGSTIEEARRTLIKSGARQVIAITIAH